MNVPKLKGMMAEKGVSGNMLASKTGIERSKLHRRLNNGNTITVEEAQLIKDALDLTTEEAVAIFFN